MDHGSKCKAQNYRIPEDKHLGFGDDILDTILKA
jgi:hypothetical protein